MDDKRRHRIQTGLNSEGKLIKKLTIVKSDSNNLPFEYRDEQLNCEILTNHDDFVKRRAQ